MEEFSCMRSMWKKQARIAWGLVMAGVLLLTMGIVWQYRISSRHTTLFNRSWLMLSRGEEVKKTIQTIEVEIAAIKELPPAKEPPSLIRWSEARSDLRQAYSAFERSLNRLLEQAETSQETLWSILEFKQRWSEYQNRLTAWETKIALNQQPPWDAQFAKQTQLELDLLNNHYSRQFSASMSHLQQSQIAAFLLCLLGMGALGFGIWARWLRAVWLLKDLQFHSDADSLPPLPPSLKNTEWEQVWETIQQMGHRLRLSEQFMRDLSMGRQPVPLPPEGENDQLARSSYWLARYWEQLQAEIARSRRAS